MSKISELTPLTEDQIDGYELAPVTKGSSTFRAPIAYLARRAALQAEAARDVAVAAGVQYTSEAAAVADLEDGAFGSYLDAAGHPVWGQRVGAGMVPLPGPWIGSGKISYHPGGMGAVERPVETKLGEIVTVTDFGASGPKIAEAIAAHPGVTFPAGSYNNTDTALVLPFGKIVRFQHGATLTNSGSGSFAGNGTVVHENLNPSGLAGWTGTWPIAGFNYTGHSVDIGGYGPRTFGKPGLGEWNKLTAIGGAVNVPSNSALFGTIGVSGHVKNASVFTNSVGLYGQADREAPNALVWGINTVTWDNGHGGLNVWGYELNLNISNVNTLALGLDIVGGSTVEPNLSMAIQVQALGVFESPKKRWTYAMRTRDAAAIVGIELGAQLQAANSPSQPFYMNFMTGAGRPGRGFSIQVDGSGNAQVNGGTGATLFVLRTPSSTAGNIQLLGNGIGFFGNFPQDKRIVSGSRGGNAALASVLTGLDELGLIDDQTTP